MQAASVAAPDCTAVSSFQASLALHAKWWTHCAQQNKACLTTSLVFVLYTVSLSQSCLATATRVPEAFQVASQEALEPCGKTYFGGGGTN